MFQRSERIGEHVFSELFRFAVRFIVDVHPVTMEHRLDPGMRPFLVLVAAGCLATITTSVANGETAGRFCQAFSQALARG